MDDAREPGEAAAAPWSARRRWTVGALSTLGILVVLALVAFVPGPIFRIIQTNSAHQLVADVAAGREELLAEQDEIRAPLADLGEPVRAWTQVSCWLAPRYSDGDGEQNMIMFYWQECALVSSEIYPVPPELRDGTDVAFRLGSRAAGEGTCDVTLYGVLTPDVAASTADEYATELRWVDPESDPPSDQPFRCDLPTPDDPEAAHVTIDVDEPMTADSYVVYQVRSPIGQADVGCERALTWLAPCAGEPDGFPAF